MAKEMGLMDSIILEFHPCCEPDGGHCECGKEWMSIEARNLEDTDWSGLADEQFPTRACRVDIVVEKCLLEYFSSYFRALKSFREADCKRVLVDWDVSLFIILLKFFYTLNLELPTSRISTLLETSVFFGVDEAIERIEKWAILTPTTSDPNLIEDVLKGLPAIWEASHRYGHSTLINFCSRFLVLHFISATALGAFKDLPYGLLNACVNHPQLTVDSEKRLYDALITWCEEQDLLNEARETASKRKTCLLSKVRASLIPLKVFLARYPMKTCLDYSNRKIRITHYLKRFDADGSHTIPLINLMLHAANVASLDLSGCHEVDDDMLFQSSASAPVPDEPVTGDKRVTMYVSPGGAGSSSVSSLEGVCSSFQNISPVRRSRWPVGRSFEDLTVVNVSQCNKIPQDSLVVWLREACPNLNKLVAEHCPQIGLSLLPALSKNCPHLQTLDLSLETILVEENEICKTTVDVKTEARSARLHCPVSGLYAMCRLTCLSLRGRNELGDHILYNVAVDCQSLLDLDVSMCTTLSDHGISEALSRLQGLRSLRAKGTKFGPSCCKVLSKGNDLQCLDLESCHGLSSEGIALILEQHPSLETLLLGDTLLGDNALLRFKGNRLQKLSVRDTKELGSRDLLEEFRVGWRFTYFGLEAMKPSLKLLRSLEVGVGGNFCNMCLGKISTHWQSLQKLSLCFQTIDDDGITQILDRLRCLQVLEVQNTISYLTPKGIYALANRCPASLKVLKLDRFAPGISDEDLLQLSRSCSSLSHFSLVGCKYLTARSLVAVSQNMRALTELRLEECEGLTANGGGVILESCKALERLILRHNGKGVEEDFVMKAAKELPHLWYLSLDVCDSISDRFQTPEEVLPEVPLSTVLLARCQRLESGLLGPIMPDGKPKRYHKDTIVLRWTRERTHACTIRRRVY